MTSRRILAGRRAAPVLAALMLGGAPHAGVAQSATPRVQPEVRVDLIVGHQAAVQAGAGVQIPLGAYMRLGMDAAAGVRVRGAANDGAPSYGARADVLARFLLDPFRQSRYGLSVGGGLSVRAEEGDRARPWLLVAAEVEGRRWSSGWVPALQVGLGGGARVGVVVRGAGERGR